MNFPSLSGAGIISLDVETCDPNLKDRGPGSIRKDGFICGVSIATDDGFCEYLPVRHEAGGNLDRDQVFSWLRTELAGSQPKLGANISYDLEWMRSEGLLVGGPKWDIQMAEALLDENRVSYSLDNISKDRLGDSKDESGMTAAAIARGIPEKDVKGNIWRLHADEVAPYGRQDVLLPLKIWEQQKVQIADEGLQTVFNLESDIIDVLLEMRFKGVRIDEERARISVAVLDKKKLLIEKSLKVITGQEVDYWSNKVLGQICDKLGLAYTRTGKDNPSFDADWLSEQSHPFFKQIAEARLLDRAGSVFIKSKILGETINGRVHCQYYSVRNDRGGTRTGRFACANPNLQQVPARNEELSKIIRSCFVPDVGEEWLSSDWSQVEPRVTVHYAKEMNLPGAGIAAQKYCDDPKTDYHQMVADMAGIGRKAAKTINLGLSYGMGKDKLAVQLGMSRSESDELYAKYHSALPFIKLLTDRCSTIAEKRGYVRTITGRRRRFDLFGPSKWKPGLMPLKFDEAIKAFGHPLKRYFCHKSMNAVIQGSSADLMKILMVRLHKEGLTPNLTVHDEICKSCKDREEMIKIRTAMETVYKLHIPLYADTEVGPSWGESVEVKL